MFSATDVANFLACQHTAKLALEESRGEIRKPIFHDPSVELLQTIARGNADILNLYIVKI